MTWENDLTFLHVDINLDTNFGRLAVALKLLGRHGQKWSLNHGTLKSGVSHKWFDEFVLVITCLKGKFGRNLPGSLFWNFEISKFQKMNEVNFPQISRINIWFLVNQMWQALKEHTRVEITQKQVISIVIKADIWMFLEWENNSRKL